jgi:hypothetical protein
MEQKSYLSIDLDYWNDEYTDGACKSFFKKVFALGLPITIVDSHERLLYSVNSSGANVLYNVDFHSDFFGYRSRDEAKAEMGRKIQDGTWVNHVRWRRKGSYFWMYPEARCYGNRESYQTNGGEYRGDGVCWVTEEENPFFPTTYNEWKSVKRLKGHRKIDWETIVSVGVAISRDYLTGNLYYAGGVEKCSIQWAIDMLKIKKRLNTGSMFTKGSKWVKVLEPVKV